LTPEVMRGAEVNGPDEERGLSAGMGPKAEKGGRGWAGGVTAADEGAVELEAEWLGGGGWLMAQAAVRGGVVPSGRVLVEGAGRRRVRVDA